MSMPFYVAPEQQMKDRADFARKGIARGRSVVVLRFRDGILFVAENRSQALHKVSEIYDRIAFAAVGRYNEFETLRIAGIRYADLRGYSYARTDVTARGLANNYAQLLGTIFSTAGEKPYEVEIVVAELAARSEDDQIYRLSYDGSVTDEKHFAVMGGSAEAIDDVLAAGFADDLSLEQALRLAVTALGSDGGPNAAARELGVDALEVAVLDRSRPHARKFRRLGDGPLAELLAASAKPADSGPADDEVDAVVADRDDASEPPNEEGSDGAEGSGPKDPAGGAVWRDDADRADGPADDLGHGRTEPDSAS